MTSRVSGFVVTLEKNLREDDAQEIANAISLLRGVTLVSPVESDPLAEQVTTARVRQQVVTALLSVFDEGKKP